MLQGVHAVAGLTPRTAYLSHAQDAAPSPRTGSQCQGSSTFRVPCYYLPSRLTLQRATRPAPHLHLSLNLHLLVLFLPFPFPSTGRPLDCAFPNLVGSVIHKVRLHPRQCPAACCAAALLLDRLGACCCLRRQSTSLASVCTLYHDFTFSFSFPFPILSPTLGCQAPNL